MQIKVTQNEVKINKDILNDGEYNIHKCQFDFDEEYTGLVQKAVFTLNDGTSYLETIVNNECNIPIEVLEEGVLKIGVYAYETNNDELVLRYSPSPDIIHVFDGSYVKDAQNSEGGTPTEYEQLESRVNTALNEIDEALEDVETAVNEANNLDIDVSKTGKVATIDVTKKNGTVKTVTLSDGTSLMFNWDGTKLGIKTDEDAEYTYVDLQGVQGPIGPKGEAFTIKKTYTSVAEMNADFNNMQLGDYVMIASTVEVEDNAKLYTRGETQWIFISDFSGATGIRGETGLTPNIQIGTVTSGSTPSVTRTGTNENPVLNFTLVKGDTGVTGPQGETGATGNGILSIQKTATVGLVDTYTITFTDGTTTTFDVTNGEDGEVTQAQLDETNNNVSWLQTLTEQMPTVSGQGTDLSLESVLNYRLMKFLPQGVSSQFSTTGKNLLPFPYGATTKTENGITWTVNEDGSIDISGTSTGNSFFYLYNNNVSKLITDTTKTYTLQIGKINSDIMLSCFNYVNSNLERFRDDTTFSKYGITFTPTANGTGQLFRLRISSGVTMNTTIYPIIIEGDYENTLQSYESYTGGIAAPNPSYPFMPSRVTGENSLVLQNENLFDKNNTDSGYIDATGNFVSNASWTSTNDYIQVLPNSDYVLKLSATKRILICEYDKNYLLIGSRIDTNSSSYSLTTSNSAKYIKFSVYTQVDTPTIMLVKGSTAPTTYVEHEEQNYTLSLGNIELNSTPDGSIRDYIYGSPNNWFKREYIGKVVLDGSENISGRNEYIASGRFDFLNITDGLKGSSGNPNCISNYYRGNFSLDDGCIFLSGIDGHINIINKDYINNMNGFKSDLSEKYQEGKPVTVWYEKAQYTDIPITDTTLINQLNNIYNNAHSYKGTTNITSTYEDGNEQMYLDIEALKNVWEVTE